MAKRILLFSSTVFLLFTVLTSNKSGPSSMGNGNKTGGPGSGGNTCGMAGCHTSGIGTTTGGFEVRKKFKPDSGAIVNKYIADSLYLVRLSGSNLTLSKFGFQLCALKVSDSNNAGTFSNLGSKMKSVTDGGKTLLEHNDTISKVGSNVDIVFTWKAPAKNTGMVRFYAVLNAVNGDGLAANDKASSPIVFTLAESLNIPYNTNAGNLKAYPNPTIDVINIQNKYAANGDYQLQVINSTGQVIMKDIFTVQNNLLSHKVNTANWVSGLYILYLSHNGEQEVTTIVKQ